MTLSRIFRIVSIALMIVGGIMIGIGEHLVACNEYKIHQAFSSQLDLNKFQKELANPAILSNTIAYIPPASFPLIVQGEVVTVPDYYFPYGTKYSRKKAETWPYLLTWTVPLFLGAFILGTTLKDNAKQRGIRHSYVD